MLRDVRPAIVMMALFTLLCGLVYPLAMTGIARALLPAQSGGSLIHDGKTIVGSTLIAQGFARPEYLHPRPSGAGKGWDPMNSGGTNMGPMDKKVADRVATDAAALRKENPGAAAIPADAVTTSGSGLDPDVSPENARFQAARIAGARGVTTDAVQRVINRQTGAPFLGFVGQPHVNVLAVNRALDAALPVKHLTP